MSAPTAQYYYINGHIVDATAPALQLQDLGLYRGWAVFDYIRTHRGKPLLLADYLKRFRESAAALRLQLPCSNSEIEQIILELLQLNGFAESGIRLLLSGGYAADVFTPAEPNFIIRIEASKLPAQKVYAEGVSLLTDHYLRDWPEVKHTNYLNAIRKWPQVQAAGATEILYHWQDEVLECSRSNFFMVKAGKVFTSTTNKILAGVTRAKVLALAQKNGLETVEQTFSLQEVRQADEAFITGTTKRIMPVVKIDEHPIAGGKVGPISQKLLTLWLQEVEP